MMNENAGFDQKKVGSHSDENAINLTTVLHVVIARSETTKQSSLLL
jgi:hypothetical protein